MIQTTSDLLHTCLLKFTIIGLTGCDLSKDMTLEQIDIMALCNFSVITELTFVFLFASAR